MGLIGVSGKIGCGKDTVGKIIQYLIWNPEQKSSPISFEDWMNKLDNDSRELNSSWEIKKFADKLKDIVCILIGCTREQLENREFKEKELGEEWCYYISSHGEYEDYQEKIFFNEEYAISFANEFYNPRVSKKQYLTPRKLFTLLGTECGREIIHPNIWCNSLFSGYKDIKGIGGLTDKPFNLGKPDWIITDVRFPNEVQAIKDRGGTVIRVNRPFIVDFHGNYVDNTYESDELKVFKQIGNSTKWECKLKNEHESETALDTYQDFDYIVDNSGNIEDLVEKVREILIKEKIISK